MMPVTCYLLFTMCYLLSDNCYLKLATSCKKLFPFAPVVRLALVVLNPPLSGKDRTFYPLPFYCFFLTPPNKQPIVIFLSHNIIF